MSKGPHTFKRRDVTRAIEAALAAGIQVARAEIDPRTGKIILVFGDPKNSNAAEPGGWDNI
jgi:hypothetical protein